MGAADSDLIFKAIDSAERQVSESAEASAIDESPTAAESTPEPVDEIAEAQAATNYKEAKERARDESGKFAKAEKTAPKAGKPAPATKQISQDAAAPELEAVQVEETQGAAPIEIPGMWNPKEKETLIAKAPREVQEIIARREAQRAEYDRRVASEIEPLKARYTRMEEVYSPYRTKYQAMGIKDDIEAASRLLAWNEILEQDPRAFVVSIMQKNGLTPQDLLEEQAGTQNYSDPRYDEIARRAELAEKRAEEVAQAMEMQRKQAGQQALEQFKSGVDSSGSPRAQFFESYRPQIVQAFAEIQKLAPHLGETEALNHAYEYVLGEFRKLHGSTAPKAPSQPKQLDPALAAKARAAAKSVTGAPREESAPARSSKSKGDFNKRLTEVIDSKLDAVGL